MRFLKLASLLSFRTHRFVLTISYALNITPSKAKMTIPNLNTSVKALFEVLKYKSPFVTFCKFEWIELLAVEVVTFPLENSLYENI